MDDDDLIFIVEANENESELRLSLKSRSNQKIEQHEFIMALESYLHEVAKAEIYRHDHNSPIH